MKAVKKKIRCPNCGVNMTKGIQRYYKSYIAKEPNREEFSPYGYILCPNCQKEICFQILGDREGFEIFFFKNERDFDLYLAILKEALENGEHPTIAVRHSLSKIKGINKP